MEGTLSAQEKKHLENAFLYPWKLHMISIGKLYASHPSHPEWQDLGLCGAWTICSDEQNKRVYLRLYDHVTRTRYFSHELYEQFEYLAPKNYFHTFESNDCIYGISFADECEAKLFHGAVLDIIRKKEYHLVPNKWTQTMRRISQFGKGKNQKPKDEVAEEISISQPRNFEHVRKDNLVSEVPKEWIYENPEWANYFKQTLNLSDNDMTDTRILFSLNAALSQFLASRESPNPVRGVSVGVNSSDNIGDPAKDNISIRNGEENVDYADPIGGDSYKIGDNISEPESKDLEIDINSSPNGDNIEKDLEIDESDDTLDDGNHIQQIPVPLPGPGTLTNAEREECNNLLAKYLARRRIAIDGDSG